MTPRNIEDWSDDKILTLQKMERRTLNAFIIKGIESKFHWPMSNELKEESILRKKRNSLILKSERNKSNRRNENSQVRNNRLEKERLRDRKRRLSETQAQRYKRLCNQKIRDKNQKGKCPICMNKLTKTIGIPDCCLHPFCFDYITAWSAYHCTCPIDRKKFSSIAKKSTLNGYVLERTAVSTEERTHEQDESLLTGIFEDYEYSCHICGGTDRADTMLLCDSCDRGFHFDTCMVPTLLSIPTGLWLCSYCEI